MLAIIRFRCGKRKRERERENQRNGSNVLFRGQPLGVCVENFLSGSGWLRRADPFPCLLHDLYISLLVRKWQTSQRGLGPLTSGLLPALALTSSGRFPWLLSSFPVAEFPFLSSWQRSASVWTQEWNASKSQAQPWQSDWGGAPGRKRDAARCIFPPFAPA